MWDKIKNLFKAKVKEEVVLTINPLPLNTTYSMSDAEYVIIEKENK